jgi:murein DD-endopeptidase MepM/ murein hydrolase activator NlpD
LKSRKRKTKYYTFLLIPDNERETKSLKLRISVIWGLVILFIITSILIITGAATYWKVAELALDYNRLSEENVQLKKSLAKVAELQADIDKLKQVDQKLRSSLSGFVTMVDDKEADPENILTTGIENIGGLKHDRSIFTSIPAEIPLEGFTTRGFETGAILSSAHIGIDIAAEMGSPIKATADGMVIFSGWTFHDGYMVILKHKYNFFSFYKHNQQNLCQELEYVQKGQVIALLGDTGQITSGAHLHFEIWQGSMPLDPITFLQMSGI